MAERSDARVSTDIHLRGVETEIVVKYYDTFVTVEFGNWRNGITKLFLTKEQAQLLSTQIALTALGETYAVAE
jgi:hypothetical protein